MYQKLLKLTLPTTLVFALLAGNLVLAHKWGDWHWDRSGSSVTVGMYNQSSGRYYTEANQSINDWNYNTLLYLPKRSYHTDMSVYQQNSGDTGWAGLASVEDSSGWHLKHVHAQVNTYYTDSQSDNYIQGIFCQEIGHGFGLDHSATGDCMGLGYYSGSTYYTSSHNHNDIYNMYRYSHH
jgi:predicted Zn-dependent protease